MKTRKRPPAAPRVVIQDCTIQGGASAEQCLAVQKLAEAVIEAAKALSAATGSTGIRIGNVE